MMNLRKYFWSLDKKALKETEKIIKNPDHPKFVSRIFMLLSRCDSPNKLFHFITRKQFIENWPKVRRYWIRTAQSPDFRAWWETIYEGLLEKEKRGIRRKIKGEPTKIFTEIGKIIKKVRIEKGWSQSVFAYRCGMNQPDISAIESGKKNITLETLVRLCEILGIKDIPLKHF